ncbi:MAG: hypothetical protein RSB59_07180 [Clostridia bacterium]
MKNTLFIGTVLGVVTATAIYSSMNKSQSTMKKARKAFVDKIEDILL